MTKYDYAFKKQVVEAYQRGEGGYKTLADRYSISAFSTVKKWIKIVDTFGFDALHKRITKQSYSSQFKQDVIHYYLNSGDSYLSVALKYGLSSGDLIQSWHQVFLKEGIQGLSPKPKGRPSMSKKNKKTIAKKTNDSGTRTGTRERTTSCRASLCKKAPRFRDEYLGSTQERDARIIHALRKEFRLTILLEATKFPKATYMYWKKRFDRKDPNAELEKIIKDIFEENKGNYGYRRIQLALKERGMKVNQKKIRRIMRKLGLKGMKFTRKSRKYNSYKGTVGRRTKNLIHRRFYTSIPHQKMTPDTSEFKYYEPDQGGKPIIKKLYLDPFLDMFNGEVLSYRTSKKPNAQAILDAQEEAIKRTSDCTYRRTFHSDQGWAYQMKEYQNQLTDKKIFQSMSRKGNCFDNAPMENFFGLLNQEMYHGEVYTSFESLAQAIDDWINYYNHHRIKTKLGCSPVQYRERMAA